MNKTLAFFALTSLSFTSLVYAEDFYSNKDNNGNYVTSGSSGYSSSYSSQQSGYQSSGSSGYQSSAQSNNTYPTPQPGSNGHDYPRPSHHDKRHHDQPNISVSIGSTPVVTTTYFRPAHPRPSVTFTWSESRTGYAIPRGAIEGGYQTRPGISYFVCRAPYQGGYHPGKLYAGKCHISYGGNEVVLSRYQVLTSPRPMSWIAVNHGMIPMNAIEGGYENGRPLYICQAKYHNGWHTGKVVRQRCYIGWGGQEVAVSYFNVLVR